MVTVATRRALPILAIVAGVVALLLLWALQQQGGSSLRDGGSVSGLLEYTVRDASGNLKEHKLLRNAVTGPGFDAAVARLFTTVNVTATERFIDIRLLDTAKSGGAVVSGDGTENIGISSGPTVTTPATVNGDTTGNATIVTGFAATGAAPIVEIQLVKNGPTQSGTMAWAATEVLAYRSVSITLASGDTLTVTWTVDID